LHSSSKFSHQSKLETILSAKKYRLFPAPRESDFELSNRVSPTGKQIKKRVKFEYYHFMCNTDHEEKTAEESKGNDKTPKSQISFVEDPMEPERGKTWYDGKLLYFK